MTSNAGDSQGAGTLQAVLIACLMGMTVVAVILGIKYVDARSKVNVGKRPITVEWAVPKDLTVPEDFIQVERGEEITMWNNTVKRVVLSLSYGEFEPHASGMQITLEPGETTKLTVAKTGANVADKTKLHFEWDDGTDKHPGSGVIIVRGP